MAGSNLKPIVHKNFKNEIDKEFVDVEDIGMPYLSLTTNLSPFRKEGSLVQSGGLSYATLNGTDLSITNLPNPGSSFRLVDFYKFSVDRDEKECTILVFEHSSTGEIKLYVNPYFNPSLTFDNWSAKSPSGATISEDSWVHEWFELTEKYTGTLETGSIGNFVFDSIDLSPSVASLPDDYFNNWFVVNTTVPNYYENKYNYVTDYNATDKRFTVKSQILPTGSRNWLNGNSITLVRFPVIYFHNAVIPGTGEPYTNTNSFKAKPTQFIYHQNQLRMPCGKNLRPIVLDMIYKRKYLSGANVVSYDGFWLDFQQPIQVLKDSAVSAFGAIFTPTSSSYKYYEPTSPIGWSDSAPASGNYLRFKYLGSSVTYLAIRNRQWVSAGFQYDLLSGIHVLTVNGLFTPTSLSSFKSYFDLILGGVFEITVVGSANFPTGAASYHKTSMVYGATGGYGTDAGSNTTAVNLFLGSKVVTTVASSNTEKRMPFILTLTLDNRNEVVIGHGNAKTATTFNSIYLYFNSWFSRKITHINFYNGDDTVESASSIPTVVSISEYPYFAWVKATNINNLPLKFKMPFDNLTKSINGELNNIASVVDTSTGANTFTFFETNWYTIISVDNNDIETKGTGLTFISNVNRFIDEDITMNYTRGTFVGETNGRLFICGCKNAVESKVFETDDNVVYNTFASGVSSYDCFSKSNLLNVFVGDKDILVDLKTFEGRILAVKKMNCFVIDVNTEDELRFRVTKTEVGRGANYADSICVTPHGIVLPVEDSVYLINSRGAKPIFRANNGRLDFYKDLYPGSIINCAYYGMYDELYLTSISSDNTQVNTIMVYSFKYDAWTTYNYNTIVTDTGLAIKKIRENSSKGVEFASVLSNTAYNILKIDESVTSYKNVNGGTEYCQWVLSTPYLPYGDKILDILIHAFTLHYDIFSTSNKVLKLTIRRNGRSDEVKYLGTGATADNKVFNELLGLNGETDQLKIRLENVNSSGEVQNITLFNINSFIIWATFQPRQLTQTLNS